MVKIEIFDDIELKQKLLKHISTVFIGYRDKKYFSVQWLVFKTKLFCAMAKSYNLHLKVVGRE
jgi:hypothetical protein